MSQAIQTQPEVTIVKDCIFSTCHCDDYSYPLVKHCLKNVEDKTKFRVPGSEYTAAFKKGWWDGFNRVVNSGTKTVFGVPAMGFYTGYMREVITEFVRNGIKIHSHVSDAVANVEASERREFPWNEERFKLHPYQEETINVAIQKSRGIINLATGAGKGVVGAALIRALGVVPVIFLVTTKDLMYQAQTRFEATMPGVKVGIVGDGQCDIQEITVCTIQSCAHAYGMTKVFDKELKQLKSALEIDFGKEQTLGESNHGKVRNLVETARVVIFDEIHRAPCDMCKNVLEMTRNAVYRFGLGATVERDDSMDKIIRGLFGEILIKITASELIRAGYLTQPQIMMVPIKTGSLAYNTYAEEYRVCVEDNAERNGIIVNIAKKMANNDKPTLILVKNITHGNKLLSMLDERFVLVTGKETSKKRDAAFKAIMSGAIKGIIATSLADEGLDLPLLECLILAGGGKSRTSAMQRIGRVTRVHPEGKHKDAFVIDFFDASKTMRKHSKVRMALYEKEPEFKIEVLKHENI